MEGKGDIARAVFGQREEVHGAGGFVRTQYRRFFAWEEGQYVAILHITQPLFPNPEIQLFETQRHTEITSPRACRDVC